MLLSELIRGWCDATGRAFPIEYAAQLDIATARVQPCFVRAAYGDRYRQITSDRVRFAVQQLNSAVEEAAGAARLLEMIPYVPSLGLDIGGKFLRHALDEIRHHGIFLEILAAVFPEVRVSQSLREACEACVPRVNRGSMGSQGDRLSINRVLEEIVQINVGEIRNLVQLRLSLPVLLAHAPTRDAELLVETHMNTLISDEGGHIYYTALLYQELAGQGYKEALAEHLETAMFLFHREAALFMWPRAVAA